MLVLNARRLATPHSSAFFPIRSHCLSSGSLTRASASVVGFDRVAGSGSCSRSLDNRGIESTNSAWVMHLIRQPLTFNSFHLGVRLTKSSVHSSIVARHSLDHGCLVVSLRSRVPPFASPGFDKSSRTSFGYRTPPSV
jgi:hypothetical protein